MGGVQGEQSHFLRITLLCSSFALILNFIRIYIKYFLDYNATNNLFNTYEHYSHVALGIALFCLCFLVFQKSNNNVLLRFSDKYSYEIYIVHHFIVNSKYSLLNYISNPLIGVVVSILVILLTAVVLNIINNSLHDIFYKRIKRRQTLE